MSRRRPRTEDEIEGLRALAGQPLEGPARATVERALERGLGLVAGRAALLVADADARDLGPALERSFLRFLLDPVKTDPGCAAKRAIVKALNRLEVDAADTLRRGARHVQMEPVWGGHEDAAADLRATSVLALVQSIDLGREGIMRELVDALADDVRVLLVVTFLCEATQQKSGERWNQQERDDEGHRGTGRCCDPKISDE